MRYKSAQEILPKELMDEVQKYIQGEYLYVPKAEGNRKKWGDNSDYRRNLSVRNDNIRREYKNGKTVSDLSKIYYLSENTIKKIVYVKSHAENI